MLSDIGWFFSPTLHLCLKGNVSTKGNFSKSLIKASDKKAGSLSVSVKSLRKLLRSVV